MNLTLWQNIKAISQNYYELCEFKYFQNHFMLSCKGDKSLVFSSKVISQPDS